MYHPIEVMAIEIFQPANHFSNRLKRIRIVGFPKEMHLMLGVFFVAYPAILNPFVVFKSIYTCKPLLRITIRCQKATLK